MKYLLSLEDIIKIICSIKNKCGCCDYYKDRYCITSLCDDYSEFKPNKSLVEELVKNAHK